MTMRKVTQSIVLNSRPEDVCNFITEPKNFPKYVYGYIAGKIISPNKTGIGATYEWYGKLGPLRLKSIEKIVRWQATKNVAYSGQLFGINFDSSMALKKTYTQTHMTASIKYKVPIYFGGAITDWLFIQWIVKDYVKKSLDNLEKIFNK